MILSTDIKEPVKNILNTLNNYPRDIQSVALLHGSASKLDTIFYISDVDVEIWMRFQNNKKELYENFIRIIDLMIDNNMYFNELITGIDNRFEIKSYLRKDCSIFDYNPIEIRKQYNNLYKKKIINKKELLEILKYVKDKSNLIYFKKLKLETKKLGNIIWSLDEIKKGYKIFRKKKYILYDFFMKKVFLSNFIFEYEEGNYVLFDIAFHVFSFPDKYKTLNPPLGEQQYNFLIDNSEIYGEVSRRSTSFYYDSFFRNYVKGKYLKMIKRLRSMLAEYVFRPDVVNIINNDMNKKFKNPKYKSLLHRTRKDIQIFTKSKKISCLNQLKNRLDIIILLTKYKPDMEIKRLIIDVLNDSKEICDYYPDNVKEIYNNLKNYNKKDIVKELEEYSRILFNHLNEISLPHLIKYIDRLQFLLPFNIILPLPKIE